MSEFANPADEVSKDIGEVIDVAGYQFNERKDRVPPQIPSNQNLLLGFIVSLLEAIYDMISNIAINLSHRISAVESAVQTLQEDDEEETGEASAAIAAPPTTTTSRPTRSARSKRCQKCHARGHDVSDCRTADPAAMRRRVASNSRLAKEARANSAMPTISAQAPSYFPYQPPYPMPVTTPPVNFANLVADATELRRRAAQSSRDRRVNRRRRPSTTS